jgi:DNA-binding LacI/PurR family transcriptional regulator
MTTSPIRLDAYRLRRVAVAADVDPRTVARVVAGARVQRVTRGRVEEALRAEGLAQFVRSPTPPSAT